MNSILRIIPGLPGHGGVINKQPTNAHTGAQPAVAGPQQSQYIALYDWRRCHVRAFCRATSDAAFSLLAQHADVLGACEVPFWRSIQMCIMRLKISFGTARTRVPRNPQKPLSVYELQSMHAVECIGQYCMHVSMIAVSDNIFIHTSLARHAMQMNVAAFCGRTSGQKQLFGSSLISMQACRNACEHDRCQQHQFHSHFIRPPCHANECCCIPWQHVSGQKQLFGASLISIQACRNGRKACEHGYC
eukprot:1157715-Pelagomonas_calceolata.AAC.5